MYLPNPSRNQSEAGVELASDWGASLRSLIGRGYRALVPGEAQPPLAPSAAHMGVDPNRSAHTGRAGAVAGRMPNLYGPAFDRKISGTMLYVNFFGAFLARPARNSTVIARKGYAGIYPSELQPKVSKVYPWSDPTRGSP